MNQNNNRIRKLLRMRWIIAAGLLISGFVAYELATSYVLSHASETAGSATQHLLRNDTQAARKTIAWLAWFDPNHPQALYIQAKCHQLDGEVPKSIEYFENSLAALGPEPDDTKLFKQVTLSLGTELVKHQQIDRAEKVLRKHLAEFPRTDVARGNLKSIFHWQLRTKEAISLLEERLQLLPNDLSVLPDLLTTSGAPPNADESLTHCQQINKRHPDQPSIVAAIGYAFWKMGDFDSARQHLQEALRLDPENRRIKLILANFCIDDGEVEKATSLVGSIPNTKNSNHYWEVRSRIAERRKDYKQALALIEKALVENPFDREYLFIKTRLCQRLGKREAAEQLHVQMAGLAKAQLDLEVFALQLGGDVPTKDECRQIAQLYAMIGRSDLASAWQRLQNNLDEN